MKYQVITITTGKVKMNSIVKIGTELNGFEVVTETRTKKEAEAIVESLDGWITLA